MQADWQWIVAGLLLAVALWYVGRLAVRSFKGTNHDCPDCEVADLGKKKKVQKES